MNERNCIGCLNRQEVDLGRSIDIIPLTQVCLYGETLYAKLPCKFERRAIAVVKPRNGTNNNSN